MALKLCGHHLAFFRNDRRPHFSSSYWSSLFVLHPLQILAGIYPVSQLQEPYSSVGYLCERTSFLAVLKLKHPSLQDSSPQEGNQGSEEPGWTAWDVCEGETSLSNTDRLIYFIFVVFRNHMCTVGGYGGWVVSTITSQHEHPMSGSWRGRGDSISPKTEFLLSTSELHRCPLCLLELERESQGKVIGCMLRKTIFFLCSYLINTNINLKVLMYHACLPSAKGKGWDLKMKGNPVILNKEKTKKQNKVRCLYSTYSNKSHMHVYIDWNL